MGISRQAGVERVGETSGSAWTVGLLLAVVVATVLGPAGAHGRTEGASMTTSDGSNVPAVSLEAEPEYLLGFPMIVAVTYDNRASGTQFLNLPELMLWTTRGPFSLRFEPLQQGAALETRPYFPDIDEVGMLLDPGQTVRMPLDLSNVAAGLQAGRYRLTFTLYVGKQSRSSRPVELAIAAPSAVETAEAARLRRLGRAPIDTGAWAPFLTRNWNTVVPAPGLGAAAARQLRLHVLLHRAFYGPLGPREVDLSSVKALDGPVLEPEGRLLELEGQAARKGAGAVRKQMDAIVQKWPGLRRRAEAVLSGDGLIATGRRRFGAEAEFVHPPPARPYGN
jgi:hypothetical protein